ncbi:MAG TPA: HNH endonuclease signature motif containing protein, partial [Streptosporangiaceae bacterium]|nr:HNH endonuclease signature motif containing protein [Streptosporangiaceae bacterium]
AAVLARPQVPCPGGSCRTSQAGTGQAGTGGGGSGHAVPGPVYYDRGDHAERMRLLGENARRELILRQAVALLSGPSGLAARLRAGTLTGPAASVSLPLDIGTATDTIPAHLRRAVIARDKHCAWPGGCSQRPAGCQVHHLVPRSKGGRTSLTNCGLFCAFHHLIVIHQWGWTVVLNADGTMTATSPDRTRTLRSHSPPATAA